MGDKDKKFAVIYFPSEDLYSEVPVSWLTHDRTKCWWPKSLNARANMNRGDKPQDNWALHEVRVDAYCATLKSARLKADNPEYTSSSSESHKGRGLRKKMKKYSSEEYSSDSDVITPPPTLSLNSEVNSDCLNDVIVLEISPDELGNIGQAEVNLPNNEGGFQKGNHSETQEQSQGVKRIYVQKQASVHSILDQAQEVRQTEVQKQSSLQSILEEDEATASCTNCKDQSNILKEIYVKITKLEKTMENVSKSLSCLKIGHNTQHFDNKRMELIEYLPLNTKEDIINFDKKITGEDNLKETYANFIKGIGGKDVRDFVNRCLSSLFSNELGKQCSLVGQRGNLRLDTYEFIKILQDIILMAKGSSSRYEIEKAISDWFRLSNQRITRENNRRRQQQDNTNN